MCYLETDALTFAGMLADPMIRAMMYSDGVSEQELSSLLFRVRAARVASGAQGMALAGRVGQRTVAAE